MDAKPLLNAVAAAYANLKSLEVEIRYEHESGDDNAVSRHSTRKHGWYAAPDKMRYESPGKLQAVIIADGERVHQQMETPEGTRVSSSVQYGNPMPCDFRPDVPWIGGMVFLFHRVAENVARSEYLREQAEASVVEVEFGTPEYPGITQASPVTFWIDKKTNLISRLECTMTHRMPAHDETHTSKHTHHYSYVAIDQPIAAGKFVYVRPAEIVTMRPGISGGGGGGQSGGIGEQRYETWGTSSWEDDTFVNTFKLRARNMELQFERRLSFEDGALKVVEKITGPRGVTEREYTI